MKLTENNQINANVDADAEQKNSEELKAIRSIRGRKARKKGVSFELETRKDLMSKGWIVTKFDNDVIDGELKQAKKSFNPFTKRLGIGNGFTDFLAIKIIKDDGIIDYRIYGVESKKAKYLDKEEKEKVRWLLEHNIFEKVLVAYPGIIDGKKTVLYKDALTNEPVLMHGWY